VNYIRGVKWTDEQIQFLKDNCSIYTDKELSEIYGCFTPMAIKGKRRQLKLFFPNRRSKIHSFQEVIDEMEKRNYELLSTENEYVDCHSKIRYICPKHREIGEQSISLSHLLEGKGCPYCGHIMAGLNRRLDLSKLSVEDKQKCKELGFTYIDTHREPNKDGDLRIYVYYICNEHSDKGIQSTERDAFYKLKGCRYCASKDLTIEDFNKKLHRTISTISLVEKAENICRVCLFECSVCGNTFEGYYHQITHCPICHPKRSSGESMVCQILKDHNIDFEEQKSFDDCKLKSSLYFDFYIESLNTCIEYQGIQHYKPVEHFGGERRLDLQQLRDRTKAEYCKNNNIRLITIPYTFNSVDKIENYLSTFSII
jgi:rubrerythrin